VAFISFLSKLLNMDSTAVGVVLAGYDVETAFVCRIDI